MKQVVSTAAGVEVIEVPSPMIQPGHVLVEVEYSFVSSGTEMASVGYMESLSSGVASEVAQNPALVKKLVNHLRQRGIKKTLSSVIGYLEGRNEASGRLVAIGYSCAGRVVGVGEGVTLFEPGDAVACAGANQATHSELVLVPENLTVKLPEGCDAKSASSVAVGAIAMQGVRRAGVQLGETVAVIGLGLVGLLTVQLLKAAGARVIGVDPDAGRAELARRLGIDEACPDPEVFQQAVERFTRHMGADVCMITAASRGSEIMQQAMEVTRRKGRVVVVGIVGMDLQRNPFYEKEIDLLISTSYGPGRYDDRYEVKGVDYPYSYVRWTEKRNMEEYLRLLAERRVDVAAIAEEFPLEHTSDAFARLKSQDGRPAAVFIEYPAGRSLADKSTTRVEVSARSVTGKVSVGVAGAGRFVKRVHLPSLKGMAGEVELAAIVTRSGANSVELARRFGAGYAATSYEELVGDPEIDAILIGTRHNVHASMTLQALTAGKHVFVEKPLALTQDELSAIESFYGEGSGQNPVLLTGFNRRFAPLVSKLKDALARIDGPIIVDYQMNAGYLPEDHWMRTEEGGGRNLGEACHIYDLFTFLTDSRVTEIRALNVRPRETHARNENFVASFAFENGSVATLTYTSMGSVDYLKELLHLYAGESVFVLNDYRSLEAFGPSRMSIKSDEVDKGHAAEVRAFVAGVKAGSEWPIPLWQQIQATRMALDVERQIDGTA